MKKLIKNGALAPHDPWTVLREASGPEVLQAAPGRSFIVPLVFWRNYRDLLAEYPGGSGVWLDSHETPEAIAGELADIPIIALHFPEFRDGRAFTNARELREHYGFGGELRAIGDVLRDQIFYMSRCGFDSFALRHDQDPEDCLRALGDFSNRYQASIDEPLPLFRRRGARQA